MILAGDVGGTKVHLALYDFANGQLHSIRDEKFPAHQFGSLDDVVNKFLSEMRRPLQPIASRSSRRASAVPVRCATVV